MFRKYRLLLCRLVRLRKAWPVSRVAFQKQIDWSKINKIYCHENVMKQNMVHWYRGCCQFTLSAEAIQGTALAFQGINDIHRGHSLPLGMLRVSD